MNSKILVAGFACLSVMAMAQSQSATKSSSAASASASDSQQVSSPRDTTTGQSTGKRMHKPMTVTAEVGTQEKSKPMASDDWQSPIAKVGGSQSSNVSDANPTLKPVKTSGELSAQDATLNTSSSSASTTSPRDLASGQASGKRQHQPVTFQKQADAPATQK